ncbi:MAG: NAD(P)/FAD-dependent oxidoreductase [Victivallales bacterium]|jgi:NADPH-dependent 2,4-dienoyl-CoA reductase/sulfur reductase-like enzyme
MICKKYDAVIIGGGASGLSAARQISGKGFSTAIVEREKCLGGILNQCVHAGFGLHRFKSDLTGPEYAEKDIELLSGRNIDVFTGTTVFDIKSEGGSRILYASSVKGVMRLESRAVVLAMGCRERNRGNLAIGGSRPAGIMTAGLAQRLLNIDGYLPGKKAVIIGSGDIGLIMARRLTWSGAKVMAVVEILPYPSGLARNIAQCVDDFGIPLLLGHTVSSINGNERVESVDISPFRGGIPDLSRGFNVECDTVLISAGLVPENELSVKAGVKISNATNGPYVDSSLMTNIPGVFACGNVLHVHDLVDYVSEESSVCGNAVAEYLQGTGVLSDRKEGNVRAGANVKYVVPSMYRNDVAQKFYLRSLAPFETAFLKVKCGQEILISRKLKYVRPSEMEYFTVTPEMSAKIPKEAETLPEIQVSIREDEQ